MAKFNPNSFSYESSEEHSLYGEKNTQFVAHLNAGAKFCIVFSQPLENGGQIYSADLYYSLVVLENGMVLPFPLFEMALGEEFSFEGELFVSQETFVNWLQDQLNKLEGDYKVSNQLAGLVCSYSGDAEDKRHAISFAAKIANDYDFNFKLPEEWEKYGSLMGVLNFQVDDYFKAGYTARPSEGLDIINTLRNVQNAIAKKYSNPFFQESSEDSSFCFLKNWNGWDLYYFPAENDRAPFYRVRHGSGEFEYADYSTTHNFQPEAELDFERYAHVLMAKEIAKDKGLLIPKSQSIIVFLYEDQGDFSFIPMHTSLQNGRSLYQMPEVRFGPKGQAELGDKFIIESKEHPVCIWTTSEELVFRLLRRLAETTYEVVPSGLELVVEDIGFYYLNSESKNLQQLYHNADGEFNAGGEYFISVSLNETSMTVRARIYAGAQ